MKVTYLNNVYDKDTKTEQLENILNWIKNGKYQEQVEKIRLLNASSKTKDKKEAKKIKAKLPAFFPSIVLRDRKEMNGTEEVTGTVHFDIDLDDNEGMDVDVVLKTITSHPSTIYTFLSPRGGIKFGILTDFERGFLEDMDVTRSRYPEAYARTKAILLEMIDVVFDDDMKSIKSSCHVSYDPNLYYNPDAIPLVLGKIDAMPKLELAEPSGTVDEKYILELLNYVDSNLSYNEMRAVAFCVFYYLKDRGLPILLHHFHDKHGDLKRKLTDLMKGTNRGYLSALEAQARKGGWKPKTGKGRKVETNKPSTHRFPATMPAEEAARKIAEIIRDCIKYKRPHYICLTCGVGKSETILKILQSLLPNIKVQYHSFSGALQDSLFNRFNNLPAEHTSLFDFSDRNLKVKNIKGMAWENENGETLCVEAGLVNRLREVRSGLPLKNCYSCAKISSCGYINQFGHDDQIRFASTAQYYGETSKWDNGMEFGPSGRRTKKGNFIPDLIIVDEDCIQPVTYDADATAHYQSLAMLVAECQTGTDLLTAIQKHEVIIMDDYETAKAAMKKVKAQILAGQQANTKGFDAKEFPILERLASYILTSYDDIFLDGLRFFPRKDAGNFKRDATIELNVIKKPNKLYEGIPTIYLDATAEEEMVKRVFPKVPFTKIHVKQSSDIAVHQLEGANITKQWLGNKKNVEKLVERIGQLTSTFEGEAPKIGLITYQGIRDDDKFYQTFGKKIDANVIGYFGNIRGRNDFADVDFLFVVGRYSSNDINHERMAAAVFKHDWVGEKSYVDQPVHMSDGACRALNAHLHLDHVDRIIYRHCSIAETIQAVGRGRLIYGKPKQIYLFSNESLGEDVQISGFFQMEPETFSDQIAEIAARKFIDLGKVKSRKDVGISEYMWKEKSEILIDVAKVSGIRHAEMTGVNGSRHQFSKHFLVADHAAFQAFANSANGTFTYLN